MEHKSSILPISDLTASLLSAWARSEVDKHCDCIPGACSHTKETAEIVQTLNDAFMGSPEMRKVIDSMLAKTIQTMLHDPDHVNIFRTLIMASIEMGWGLARFSLEGKQMNESIH